MSQLSISRTEKPSTAIFSGDGQFFTARTRTGNFFGSGAGDVVLSAAAEVATLDNESQAQNQQFGPRHYIKLRQAFYDDKHGNLTLFVDYLHDTTVEPLYSEGDLARSLNDESVDEHGQGRHVRVRVKKENFSSDSFAPVSDEYYE